MEVKRKTVLGYDNKPQVERDRDDIFQMIAHFRIIDLKKALKQVKEKTTGQKVELYNRLVNYVKVQRRFNEKFLEQVRYIFHTCPTAGTDLVAQNLDHSKFREQRSITQALAEVDEKIREKQRRNEEEEFEQTGQKKSDLPAPMGSKFPPSGNSDSFGGVSKSKSGKWDQKASGASEGDIIITGTTGNPYKKPKSGPPLPPGTSSRSTIKCCTEEESKELCKIDYIHNPFFTQRYFITRPDKLIPHNRQTTKRATNLPFRVPWDWYQKIESKKENYDLLLRIYETNKPHVDYLPHDIKVIVNGKELPPCDMVPASHAGVKPRPIAKPIIISEYLKPRNHTQSQIPSFCDMLMLQWYHCDGSKGRLTPNMSFVICVVRSHNFQEAGDRVRKLKKPRAIEKTLSLLKQKISGAEGDEGDEDAVKMSSMKIKLTDPILMCLIKTPVRFDQCQHLDCFDVDSYLHMNFKKPAWSCPICAKRYPFGTLRRDAWLEKLMADAGEGTREVEMKGDGTFKITDKDDESDEDSEEERMLARMRPKETVELDDTDDAVSIVKNDKNVQTSKNVEKSKNEKSSENTVETSKRKPDFICLDDSDEELPRPTKKQKNPPRSKSPEIEVITKPKPVPPPKNGVPAFEQPKKTVLTTWIPKLPSASEQAAMGIIPQSSPGLVPTGSRLGGGFNSGSAFGVKASPAATNSRGWNANPFTDRQKPQAYSAKVNKDVEKPVLSIQVPKFHPGNVPMNNSMGRPPVAVPARSDQSLYKNMTDEVPGSAPVATPSRFDQKSGSVGGSTGGSSNWQSGGTLAGTYDSSKNTLGNELRKTDGDRNDSRDNDCRDNGSRNNDSRIIFGDRDRSSRDHNRDGGNSRDNRNRERDRHDDRDRYDSQRDRSRYDRDDRRSGDRRTDDRRSSDDRRYDSYDRKYR